MTTLDAFGGTVDVRADDAEFPSLSLPMRALVAASAGGDVLLRTTAASALAAAAIPWAMQRENVRAERASLEFYAGLTGDDAFIPPSTNVEVSVIPERELRGKPRTGRIEQLRFQSPYVALNPAIRERYASYGRNAVAGAQYWRHDGNARPTLFVMHGFFASPFWLNSAFFALPWFYHQGFDVMMFVMPFHGARQERNSPFNGAGVAMHGFSHFNEVIAQAVTDFRVLINHVKHRGAPSIGLTGLSLGGYMSSLLATLQPELGAVIPNAPVTDFMEIFRSWAPMGQVMSAGMALGGVPKEEFAASMAFHSPLLREPVVAKEKLMIIGGLGDRLAPPSHARALWEHWDRPRLHWYPGNHTLHVNRGAYLREMRQFMSDNGVVYKR